MSTAQILKMYTLAKLALSDANSGELFSLSKSEAMSSINFWRSQLWSRGVVRVRSRGSSTVE